jgi:hypothetical protein
MEFFADLDISMKETYICVMDREGNLVRETKAATLASSNRRRAGEGPGHPAYRLRNGAHGNDTLSRSSSIGPAHRVHRESARPPRVSSTDIRCCGAPSWTRLWSRVSALTNSRETTTRLRRSRAAQPLESGTPPALTALAAWARRCDPRAVTDTAGRARRRRPPRGRASLFPSYSPTSRL